MGSNEIKERHLKRRQRNLAAKELRTSGAFKQRIQNPKKGEYKREHLSIRDLDKFIKEEQE